MPQNIIGLFIPSSSLKSFPRSIVNYSRNNCYRWKPAVARAPSSAFFQYFSSGLSFLVLPWEIILLRSPLVTWHNCTRSSRKENWDLVFATRNRWWQALGVCLLSLGIYRTTLTRYPSSSCLNAAHFRDTLMKYGNIVLSSFPRWRTLVSLNLRPRFLDVL